LPALERPRSGIGVLETGEHVEEGRLTGAVRADKGDNPAAGNFQVVDIDRGQATEGPANLLGIEDRWGVVCGGRRARRPEGFVVGVGRHQRSSTSVSARLPNSP